jgi:hypothetical protein
VQEHQSNFSIARRIICVNGIGAHAIPTLHACSTCHHELLAFAAILVGMALKTSCPFTKGVSTVVQMAFNDRTLRWICNHLWRPRMKVTIATGAACWVFCRSMPLAHLSGPLPESSGQLRATQNANVIRTFVISSKRHAQGSDVIVNIDSKGHSYPAVPTLLLSKR